MTKAVACMLALVLALSLMPTTSLNAFNAFAQDEADTVAVDQTTTGAGATEEASAADTATAPSATEEPAPAVEGDTAGADSPDVTASDPDVSTDGSAADAGGSHAATDDPDEDQTDQDDSEDYPAQNLTVAVEGTDITVRVEAAKGVLPKDTTVKAVAVDSKAITDAVEERVEAVGEELGAMKAIDVTLHDAAGNEIQPKGKIKVTFTNTGLDSDDVSVFHVKEAADGYVAEDVATVAADANAQVFETTHFSIYAIVDTNPHARLKIVFHKADGGEPTIIYTNQTDFNNNNVDNVVYDPGMGTLGANETFRGWTTNPDYNATVAPMDIGGVRTLVKDKLQAGVSQDGETLDIYPVVFKVLHVSYLGENDSSLGSETLLLLRSEGSTSYTVNMPYTPPSATQGFEGWNVDSGGTNIDGYTAGTVYANGTEIMLSGDVVFSVSAPEGHWLVFDENGYGATYNAPQFVKSGQTTAAPSLEMKRVGYTFGGWYTDEACTPGNGFAFGGELTDNTTVYAKWMRATSASYTVLIWKQNVDGNGYDFAESITLNGTVDAVVNTVVSHGSGDGAYASVNGVDKRYTGFHLKEFDQNVTIAAEGTSIVNVYYNRNTVTLTFRYRSGNQWVTQQTMTGLYGSSLASNGYTWPTNRWWYSDYTGNWWSGYSGAGTRTTFMDAFLPPDGGSAMTFYGFNAQGSNRVYFSTQNVNAPGYTLMNEVTTGNGTFHISDKYNGFKAASYSTNGGLSWTTLGDKDPSTGYYASVSNYTNLHIRFDPLQYNVLYQDGVYVDGDGNPVEGYSSQGQLHVVNGVTYGSNMSSYNAGGDNYYEPTYDGFVFSGWYADENCTHPYTFTTMTEGITVYAKWTQIQYRVFLHPNAGTDTTLATSAAEPLTPMSTASRSRRNSISMPNGAPSWLVPMASASYTTQTAAATLPMTLCCTWIRQMPSLRPHPRPQTRAPTSSCTGWYRPGTNPRASTWIPVRWSFRATPSRC